MSRPGADFTIKFFRPPQRAVFSHNGLLDTRTKRIIAQDRFSVAEQKTLDIEKRKSATNLQLLAFEQKQFEKKLSSFQSVNHPVKTRQRSISEVNLHSIHRATSWNDTLKIHQSKSNTSLQDQHQNLLFLPKADNFRRRFSTSSDDILTENQSLMSDTESNEDEQEDKHTDELNTKARLRLPMIAVIPPEDED